jgi:hypothetical protein
VAIERMLAVWLRIVAWPVALIVSFACRAAAVRIVLGRGVTERSRQPLRH